MSLTERERERDHSNLSVIERELIVICLSVCREVFCLPKYANSTDQVWAHMVDVKHCEGQEKPHQEEECNRFPCPQYWEDHGWSQCDKTCGIGFKTLKVRSLLNIMYKGIKASMMVKLMPPVTKTRVAAASWTINSYFSTGAVGGELRSVGCTLYRGPSVTTPSVLSVPLATWTSHLSVATRYQISTAGSSLFF